MRTVNIYEAKTHLSRLLAEVEAGEEIVVARNGTPIARIVAVTRTGRGLVGCDDALAARGELRFDDDLSAPLDAETARLFEG